MTNLVIHPELKKLLPPLSDKEYAGLEEDILERGCVSPIVVWNETIVDGHNRYEICQKHGIRFEVRPLEFETLDDAMFWAWTHQENRRNLTQYQRGELALKFKAKIAEQAKTNMSVGGSKKGLLNSANLAKPINTRKALAEIANVAPDTISRIEFLNEHADEATKKKLRRGKTTINREYKQAKEKAAKPKTTRTKKTGKESPLAKPQREPESSEPLPSKPRNVPCIEELTPPVAKTTLQGIRQDDPDHLINSLHTHFRDGYINELVMKAMAYLYEVQGEEVAASLAEEIAKRYIKPKR